MLWIGIDPGVSGGYAVYDDDARRIVLAYAFERQTPHEAAAQLHLVCSGLLGDVGGCLLERVGASPQMGRGSIGTFMRQAGWCEGVLEAFVIVHRTPLLMVQPERWQRALAVPATNAKIGDTERKKLLRAFCQRRLPGFEATKGTCDAALIALAARGVLNNEAVEKETNTEGVPGIDRTKKSSKSRRGRRKPR